LRIDPTYVLDTNVFIDAEESEPFAEAAARFIATHSVRVSSVVVAELIIGTRSARVRERVLGNLREQAAVLGDVTPTVEDWQIAAAGWVRLAPGSAERRSIWNDLLLAASCSRAGATLITSNHADFKRIARHIPLRHATPWPADHDV